MLIRNLTAIPLMLILAAPANTQTVKTENKPKATAVGKVRTVAISEDKVETLALRAGFTTMLVFPAGEQIVHVAQGDRTLWTPERPSPHVLSFKPTIDGIETNLLVTTMAGKVWPFFLRETKNEPPDMKVTVDTGFEADAKTPQYFTAADVEPIKAELSAVYARIDAIQRDANIAVEEAEAKVPAVLSYYEVKNVPPFQVQGMVTNGKHTYIKMAGREAPVIYEMIDDKPSMVNYQMQGSTYVVSKVLGAGYFVLGKQRLAFKPLEGN